MSEPELPPNPHMTMTPFSRLAVVQAVSVAGDTFLNVALAGSIFFTLNVKEARPKVLLFLLCTMLPFVLLSPLIGPALDRSRSGRRLVVAACALGRAILLFLLAYYINAKGASSFMLFPLAFGALMFSKGHNVAKSSLVPAVVRGQQTFVKANSRLAIISVVAGVAAAGPAVIAFKFGNPPLELRLGAVVFIVGAVLAFRIPKAPVVAEPLSERAKEELHARSIVLSGTLMALIRGCVGFLTLLIAFWLKTQGEDPIVYGLAGGAAALGNVGGVLLAPGIRRHLREETILATTSILAGMISLVMARGGGLFSLCIVAFAVAITAAAGRLAFDSLVQRDAPDAARGRVFARYETRFQAAWVFGAILPVIPLAASNSEKARVGLFMLAVAFLASGIMYIVGLRGLRRHPAVGPGPVANDEEFLGLTTPEPVHGIDIPLDDEPVTDAGDDARA